MDSIQIFEEKKILVVEDDLETREVFQIVLSEVASYTSILVETPHDALCSAQKQPPDLFLIDCRLREIDGIELYDQLHATTGLERIPAILVSASIRKWQSALQARNLPGLAKPFSIDDLLALVQRAFSSMSI